jgi:hypothetical protein
MTRRTRIPEPALQRFLAVAVAMTGISGGALAADTTAVAPVADPCRQFGKGFTHFAGINTCADLSGHMFGYIGQDFANTDIALEGLRLPTVGNPNPTIPMLVYYEDDVSDRTKHVEIGGGITANLKLGWDTEHGPLLGYVSVGAYSDGEFAGGINDVFGTQNVYNDGDWYFYPGGFVRQAWLKYGGLMVGIQPSKFDLVHSGYSPFPGYATKDTVASAAYTFRGKNTSLSLAVEDATHRYYEDGVLADYEDGHHNPDIVGLVRHRHKNMLLHGSVALHSINDEAAENCCGVAADQEFGWAASAGAEWRFGWRNDREDPTDDRYAKFMIAAAFSEGAIGYLGIPFFATDYVARADGRIDLSRGISGVASYEYIWNRKFKTSVTGSGFWVESASTGELMDNIDLSFDVDVYGAKLQLGAEYLLRKDLVVGGEVAYNWSWAEGSYSGYDGDRISVDYPEVKAYIAYKF